MPDEIPVPDDAAAVAQRYRRTERLASGGLAITIGAIGGVAVVVLPLLWGLAVALGLLALVRVPMFSTGGRARLRTDAAPDSVRDEFAGPTSPPLALQWGIADAVWVDDGDAVYDVSYFFGLRSVEMRVAADTVADGVELIGTVDGRPWGTYAARIEPAGSGTEVVVEAESDRTFGLRQLPQYVVARRFRDAALEAQGYEVLERSFSLSR